MFNVPDVVIQLTASLAVLAVQLTVIVLTTLSLSLGRPGPESTRQAMFFLLMFMTLAISGGVRVGVPGSSPAPKAGSSSANTLEEIPAKTRGRPNPSQNHSFRVVKRAYLRALACSDKGSSHHKGKVRIYTPSCQTGTQAQRHCPQCRWSVPGCLG